MTVGDWDCDGVHTAALLRPATGEVFVFDAWAGPGVDLTARRVGRVPGATGLSAADLDGDACDEVVAESAQGPAVPLDPRVSA